MFSTEQVLLKGESQAMLQLTRNRVAAALGLVLGLQMMVAKADNAPANRNLSDFKCSDGRAPDGSDSAHDDTSALVAALNAGPGVVTIGPGFYRVGNVAIPAKVTVAGAGAGTVFRSNGEKCIFKQSGVGEWALRDVVLDGESKAQAAAVPNNGKQGLFATGCHSFDIRNLTAHHFEGIAVEFAHTDLPAAAFCNGGAICGLAVHDNFTGVAFSERAEYITGGNITIGDSHFCMNDVGILLTDKANGSHGAVENCLINHNNRFAVLAQNVNNGHNFVGCSIIYSTVKLENCRGIKIASGTLNCSIIVKGDTANQILGNYVLESEMKTWDISPATQFKDNFNASGPFSGPEAKTPK
jgi:hypothetical protein